MSRPFWPLFVVNLVFAGLIFAVLPFGPDLIYGVLAGSQLGMMMLLARACERASWQISHSPKEWDHSRGPMPPR